MANGLPGKTGLSNLLADTTIKTTDLPSWFTSAQQGALRGASNAQGEVPAVADTTLKNAVNNVTSAQSPFAQGQESLNTIASGAANPWLRNPDGSVSPNPNTALGGLFNAQQNYFNQILPNIDATATAPAIASGNFGSLRGLTALNKARGDALNQMYQNQYEAALKNQATGVQAGAGLSNLGGQYNTAALNTANAQLTDPYLSPAAYAGVLGDVGKKLPQADSTTTNYSPLGAAGTIGSALGNAGVISGLTGALGISQYELMPDGKTPRLDAQGKPIPRSSSSILGDFWRKMITGSDKTTTPSTGGNLPTPGGPPTTDAYGNTIAYQDDGSRTVTQPDGTVVVFNPDGSVSSVQDSTGAYTYRDDNRENVNYGNLPQPEPQPEPVPIPDAGAGGDVSIDFDV